MGNFDRTMELSTQAMTSSGAAASMFTTHLTGVEIASNRLAQAQQNLATNILDPETLISLKLLAADLLNIIGKMPTGVLYLSATLIPLVVGLIKARIAAKGFGGGLVNAVSGI